MFYNERGKVGIPKNSFQWSMETPFTLAMALLYVVRLLGCQLPVFALSTGWIIVLFSLAMFG